jgi:hypothetical protein
VVDDVRALRVAERAHVAACVGRSGPALSVGSLLVIAFRPHLEDARITDDRSRIFGEFPQARERGIYLVRAGDALGDDRLRCGFERRERESLRLAVKLRTLQQPHARTRDAGLEEISEKLPANRWVAATRSENPTVGVSPKCIPVVGWVTEKTAEVSVFDRDHSAHSHGGPHPLHQIKRAGEMLEQKPGVHQVVGIRLMPIVDIGRPEVDVRETPTAGGCTSEAEFDLIEVHAGDTTTRTDQSRDLERHLPAAAPDIHAMHPRPNTGQPQEVRCIGPMNTGKKLQPLVALTASPDHIATHSADRIPRAGARRGYSGAMPLRLLQP